MTPDGPEDDARLEIDKALQAVGWVVQKNREMNLSASRGVAVRQFVRSAPTGRTPRARKRS